MEAGPKHYYYAGGERHALTSDDEFLAIDRSRLKQAGVDKLTENKLMRDSQALRGNIRLIPKLAVPPELRERLAASGALQLVFREQGAWIIVLPEVRAEAATEAGRAEVRGWIDKSEIPFEIVRERGNQLLLRMTSGRGEDALEFANRLHEEVHPDLVQARFLRIVPKF